MNKKRILEIGAGSNPTIRNDAEIIHLDRCKLSHIELLADIDTYSYPFKDNTFDELIAYSVLEHASDTIRQFTEISRVCKNGAKVFIEVPYYNSLDSFTDPTHKSFFNERTMDYFTDNIRFSYYSPVRFEVLASEFYPTFLGKLIPGRLRIKAAHYIANLISGIKWTLIVKKSDT